MSRFVQIFVLTTTLAWSLRVGYAQDPAELEARTHFEEGSRLYQEGRFEEAFAAFKQSFRAMPRPVVIYNMAQMLRFQGRVDEAVTFFERYLEIDQAAPPARQAEVRQTVDELRSSMVELQIDASPPGAEISIDGTVVGEAPIPPQPVSVGEHRIRVSFPDYEAASRTVNARAGVPNRVAVNLVRGQPQGVLRVTSNVREASVEVDGDAHGRPPVEVDLRVGPHEVNVEADGHHSFSSSVRIEEGQTAQLHAELEARVPVTSRWYFWAILGGVVAVGAAVTLGIVLRPEPPQPVEGTLPTLTPLMVSP